MRGAGVGRVAYDLASLDLPDEVIALDSSDRLVMEAAALAQGEQRRVSVPVVGRHTLSAVLTPPQKAPKMKVTRGNALELPFDDARFSLAASFGTMDRVVDPKRLLRELLRVTRVGGIVAVTCLHDWEGGPAARTACLRAWKACLRSTTAKRNGSSCSCGGMHFTRKGSTLN